MTTPPDWQLPPGVDRGLWDYLHDPGIAGLTLHPFTRRGALRLLTSEGLRIVEARPISTREDGRRPWPGLFARLRACGFLIASERPRAGNRP